jgi:hypothetical protein
MVKRAMPLWFFQFCFGAFFVVTALPIGPDAGPANADWLMQDDVTQM